MIFHRALPCHRLLKAGETLGIDLRGAAFERLRCPREVARTPRRFLREQVVKPALQPAEHHGHRQLLQAFSARESVAGGAGGQLRQREITQRAVFIGGERQRRQRRAAGFRQHGCGTLHALLREPCNGGLGGREGHRPLAAAADDCWQQAVYARRDQNEHHARGRFFQRLEQCVCGEHVDRFSRIQQHDAQTAPVRAEAEKIHQPEHLIDLDLLAQHLRFLAVLGVCLFRPCRR